jgi:hypothetical protein
MSLPLPVLQAQPQYSMIIGRPIDNTALSAYMRCPSEFEKGMRQHRRSSGKKMALHYGTVWHTIQETHYKSPECGEKELIEKVEFAAIEKWGVDDFPDDIRTLPRILLDYKKYLRLFGLPWREERKTVGWPESPAVELNGELAIPGARHPYAYKIDRVVQAQKQYLIEDHKTTTRFESNFFTNFVLDNQMMGYAVAGQQLTGRPIAGVRINVYVIHKNESNFESRTIQYSPVRLEEWVRNYDNWLVTIEARIELFDRLVEDGIELQLARDTAFPMNLWACNGRKYGSCPYSGVCSMPQQLRIRTIEQDFEMVPWNPLEAEDAEAAV